MRIFLTGSQGMLARAISEVLAPRHEIVGAPHEQADIADFDAIACAVESTKPGVVINAAAFTDVDACETQQELAFRVNATGPKNLALICRRLGIPLMHFSTDYVFDGRKDSPYMEEDAPNPLSVYGHSKLEGEREVQKNLKSSWIVRVCGVFGPYRRNFVSLVLETGRRGEPLRVVQDQMLAPTYTFDAALGVEQILQHGSFGIYHLTSQGYVSRFEFAGEILRQAGLTRAEVIPIRNDEVHRAAQRPKNCCLENGRLKREGLPLLPAWPSAVERYLTQLNG